jgi:hypothetical protein
MKNKIQKPRRKTAKQKDPNRYPKGWNRQKVQRVIAHYENQTDDQAIAEDEAAYNNPAFTMMQVPKDLVPRVQKLIAKRAG